MNGPLLKSVWAHPPLPTDSALLEVTKRAVASWRIYPRQAVIDENEARGLLVNEGWNSGSCDCTANRLVEEESERGPT